MRTGQQSGQLVDFIIIENLPVPEMKFLVHTLEAKRSLQTCFDPVAEKAAGTRTEIERSPEEPEPCLLAWTWAPSHRGKLLPNSFTQTTIFSQLLSCFLVSPQPAHSSDSARVHRASSQRAISAPSGVAAPGVCESQVLGILRCRSDKPVDMPRKSSVPVRRFGAVGHRSPGLGQEVQVVGVVERRRGGACAGVSGDQVPRVLHAVARVQAVREASIYPGAFAREGAGSLRDPRPRVLDLLIDVL